MRIENLSVLTFLNASKQNKTPKYGSNIVSFTASKRPTSAIIIKKMAISCLFSNKLFVI